MSYIRRKNKTCSLCRKEIYSNEPQINLAGMFYHKPCPKNEDKSEDKSKIQLENNKKCVLCSKMVYPMDPQINLAGMLYHKTCRQKNEDKIKIQVNNNILNTNFKQFENDEEYEHTMNMTNRDRNPYRDWNNYDNDSDYQQEFYHRFSDPWKVRNDVENNGYIVTNHGEVFSPEQVKYYEKLGHNITPDSNIHG